MAMIQLGAPSRALLTAVAGPGFLLGQVSCHYRRIPVRISSRKLSTTQVSDPGTKSRQHSSERGPFDRSTDSLTASQHASKESMPSGWEDSDLQIRNFSQLPHRYFGTNQHIRINEDFKESLRQILWEFKAPIRYAFAYGSGVFSQSSNSSTSNTLTPHPHPPEAVTKWQQGGGKIIDFIFGVSFTQHWHDMNLQQHRNHYSALGTFGSYPIARIQDNFGAGVYFNPYINVNGTMIKYGVVNLDTICNDLTEWRNLYLAGRLQKPVKILRDDARVRLANQMNLMSAVRTALLMLPERFTERQLYERIAGISYLGDPRMTFGGENLGKVNNIVTNQLPNFRQVYVPLINTLPNLQFTDPSTPTEAGWEQEGIMAESRRDPSRILGGKDGFDMQQDMDVVRRGNMVRRLPRAFRQKLYYNYKQKFGIPGSAWEQSLVDETHDGTVTRQVGGEFEQRIAVQSDLTQAVQKCIRSTVAWPSTSQSIKGVLTSGVMRSWRYYSEKRAKSREGQAQTQVRTRKEQVAAAAAATTDSTSTDTSANTDADKLNRERSK